jgi:hypothetical protein
VVANPEWVQGRRYLELHGVVVWIPRVPVDHYEMVDGAGLRCMLVQGRGHTDFGEGQLEDHDGCVEAPPAQEPLVQPSGCLALDIVAGPLPLVDFSYHDSHAMQAQPRC